MADTPLLHAVTPTFVALAAPPGLLHNALVSYLQSYPQLRVVLSVTALEALLNVPGAPVHVQVIVFDAALAHGYLPHAIARLRSCYPGAGIIILVESPEQQQTARQVGVRFVLLKGHLGDALKDALEEAFILTSKIFNDDIDLRR